MCSCRRVRSSTVGANGIQLNPAGGTGTNNSAEIAQTGTSSTQSITVNSGGIVLLQGGTGAGGNNFASIRDAGTAQTLSFTSGGAINITGGTTGADNYAQIQQTNAAGGTQTISGSPTITLSGGASGGTSGHGTASHLPGLAWSLIQTGRHDPPTVVGARRNPTDARLTPVSHHKL